MNGVFRRREVLMSRNTNFNSDNIVKVSVYFEYKKTNIVNIQLKDKLILMPF